jgi:hypothetical protein
MGKIIFVAFYISLLLGINVLPMLNYIPLMDFVNYFLNRHGNYNLTISHELTGKERQLFNFYLHSHKYY